MLNNELYKDDVLRIARTNADIALKNGKPVECTKIDCDECDLCLEYSCTAGFIEWLYSEYEPRKLTKREKMFCEVVGRG